MHGERTPHYLLKQLQAEAATIKSSFKSQPSWVLRRCEAEESGVLILATAATAHQVTSAQWVSKRANGGRDKLRRSSQTKVALARCNNWKTAGVWARTRWETTLSWNLRQLLNKVIIARLRVMRVCVCLRFEQVGTRIRQHQCRYVWGGREGKTSPNINRKPLDWNISRMNESLLSLRSQNNDV